MKDTWRQTDTRELPPSHQQSTVLKDPKELQPLIADAETYWEEQFDIIREDRRMYGGLQWDPEDEEERAEDDRPAPVLNMLSVYADFLHGMIEGEQMTVSVTNRDAPGEDTSADGRFEGGESGEAFDRAGALEAHLRHLLEDSDFPAQLSDAAHKLLTTGMAYFRLYTDYESEMQDALTFRTRSVQDPLDVLFDPTFNSPDGSDGSWCAVQTFVDEKVAKKRWPQAQESALKAGGSLFSRMTGTNFWHDKRGVRVVEFFQLVEEKETRVVMPDGSNLTLKEYEKVADKLADAALAAGQQLPPPDTREFCLNRVYMSTWVGDKIVSGPTMLPYNVLPLFPILGRPKWLNDKMCYFSAIHEATDAQRMLNYAAANIMQQASRSGSAPWVATAEAVAGHEDQYADPANQDQIIYYNAFDERNRQLPAPVRQRALTADPVSVEAYQLAHASLSDIIGIDDAGMGRASNATSARSSEVRIAAQQQNFQAFIGALSRAVERVCEAIVYAIPQVYDDDRLMRVKMKDGRTDWVRINNDYITLDDGTELMTNGMTTDAHMDVRVKAVPSDDTVRQSRLKMLAELGKASPAMSEVLAPHAARYADEKLGDEVSDALISRLPLNALTPEQMERRAQMEVEAAKAGELIKLRVGEVQMQSAQMREQMGLQPEGPSGEEALAQAKVQEVQARTQLAVGQDQSQAALRDAKLRNLAAEGARAEQKDTAELEGQALANEKTIRELLATFDERVEDAVNKALLRREQAATQEVNDE